jgi:hypothetical protein
MNLEILIVIGASILLGCAFVIPAEMQIYRSRSEPGNPYYALRETQWSRNLLNRLLIFGLSLLILYIMLDDPRIMNLLLKALSLE